jgi:RecJ-like exonuclease
MSFSNFLNRCAEVKATIEKFKEPVVVGHYDCDGIAATSLVLLALRKMGKKPEFKIIRKLGEREINEIKKFEEIILTDIGIENAESEEEFKDKKIVVIDHHQSKEGSLLQANPRLFGFDGDNEVSSSGAAYFVFQEHHLADLAVVGAVGDMQTPLKGLNREILREGIENENMRCDVDLNLFGRLSRPLIWLLTYSTEPLLPGLSGNESGCARFLKEIGIETKIDKKWRRYFELGFDEKRTLISGLVSYLYSVNVDKEVIKGIIGEVYILTKHPVGSELSDANEYSTLLNACGRHNKSEIGVGVCLGEEGFLEKARLLLSEHRKQLRNGIFYGNSNYEDFGKFYFLDGRGVIEDGVIGIVAGMLYGTIDRDKPIVALALDESGEVKVSARATKSIVDAGVNLGDALKNACEGIGTGGGHKIAAGATIERDRVNEFLINFAREL